MIPHIIAIVMTIALIPLTLIPTALAESLAVSTDQAIYEYGDRLTIIINVEAVSGQPAIVFIRDDAGITSQPIPVPITDIQTVLPSPFAFDRETYPVGTYHIDVAYSDLEATTQFNLVDTDVVTAPIWIKQIAYHWIEGDISSGDYA